jgi:hypothetical protein
MILISQGNFSTNTLLFNWKRPGFVAPFSFLFDGLIIPCAQTQGAATTESEKKASPFLPTGNFSLRRKAKREKMPSTIQATASIA